ncbi:ABC transporter substrate-binding protein [Halorubrum gandharaense]
MSRRNYLQFAGATSGIALAGCLDGDPDDLDDIENGDENGEDEDDDDELSVEEDEDHLHISQTQNPTTLDPHNHRETTTDNVLFQAYELHLARDLEGNLVDAIATDWEVIDDETYRLEIRDGVQFHDGTELEPSDCAFSMNRVVDPDVGNLESPQRDQIPGVESAEVSDDGEAVIVNSDGAYPTAFADLGSYCPVVSEDWIMDREPEEVAQDINGTGPYELDEFVDGEYTDFVAFEDYWDGEAEIGSLRIDAAEESSTRINSLRAGEIDVATAVPPTDAGEIESDEDTYIADGPSTRILMLPMRNDVEPFDSQEFRQAMNYAIDLDSIVENVLSGFGDATGQPTLEGYFGHNEDIDPYPYDPEHAEELVDESGHAGVEIELTVPSGRYLLSDEIAQACVGYIDELDNVDCEINMTDFGELTGVILDGDLETSPEFFLIGWGNTTFDAQANLLPWLTEGTSQYTFVDDELEDLIAQAETETDDDAREQLLKDACELAHELAVFVFLNREYLIYGLNQRVEWEPTPDEYTRAYEMSIQ